MTERGCTKTTFILDESPNQVKLVDYQVNNISDMLRDNLRKLSTDNFVNLISEDQVVVEGCFTLDELLSIAELIKQFKELSN